LFLKLEFLLQKTKIVNNGADKTQDYSVLLALRPQLRDNSAKTTSKIAAVFSVLNLTTTAAYSEMTVILKTLSFRQKMDLSPLGSIFFVIYSRKDKILIF